MVKNPKNKRALISNAKSYLPAPGTYHEFAPETKIKLFYYEELREHTLVSISQSLNGGKFSVSTDIDGKREIDDLMSFDFSEIKAILKILEHEKLAR